MRPVLYGDVTAAARAMLAACYRALGQAEVAERLEHA